MMNRIKTWALLGVLFAGGSMLFGGCGLFTGQYRWLSAILQEDIFG